MFEVSFGNLRDLLAQQGFSMRVVNGSHVLFEHPEVCRKFVLKPYTDADRVEQAELHVVRSQLDAWGLMDSDEFDEQLRQRSLAG